jgi:predicted nucleic acid-binding protein
LIYLDASALVKLVITEDESAALSDWLANRPNVIRVTSPVARVEVLRAVWGTDPGALPEAYRAMRRLREIWLTDRVLNRAAGMRPATVGTLGAIHLASALEIREDLTGFIAYDTRLVTAARAAGLPVASPR